MSLEQLKNAESGDLVADIETNMGTIQVKLFKDIAPKAVQNFVEHSKNGYYDGIIFHRVMKDFMIQAGDPNGTGMGGKSIWGEPFEDEFHKDYHHFRGALSMANAGPNTNGSQFFIVQCDFVNEDIIDGMIAAGEKNGYSKKVIETYKEIGGTPWLDYKHSVFGQVIDGMRIVDNIARVKVNLWDKPLDPVIINSINIYSFE